MATWDWLSLETSQIIGEMNLRMKGLSAFLKLVPRYPIMAWERGVTDTSLPYGDVRRYGAVCDGVRDDTVAVQRAITAASARGGGTVSFPTSEVLVTSTLAVAGDCVTFAGAGVATSRTGVKGTTIFYTGTGPLFEIGTDDGDNWDDANYNGYAATVFENIRFEYSGTETTLSNGLGGYGADTYAIRDWRGGSVRIVRCRFVAWDFWFWGVQSDLNVFEDLIVSDCHGGCFLGPRSDQLTARHIWTFHNDTVWNFQGSNGHTVYRWITDSDGSPSICPAIINASEPGVGIYGARYAAARRVGGIVFDCPWLENLSGGAVQDVPAFFSICNSDTVQSGAVVIRDPFIQVQRWNTAGLQHTLYLAEVGYLSSVTAMGLMGRPVQIPWDNLRAVFNVLASATTPPCLFFGDRDIVTTSAGLCENYNAGAVNLHVLVSDLDATYFNNAAGGTGVVTMLRGYDYKSVLTGTTTWDPGSIAVGASLTANVTVSGAALGDTAVASLSINTQGLTLTANVTAANTVTVTLANNTAGAVDLASSTVRATVIQH